MKTQNLSTTDVYSWVSKIAASGVDVIKTEGLYSFDGVDQYSLGQGE
jgi:hypothetical protein